MVWYDQQSNILSAAQSLIDAAIEPHLVSPPRTNDTRGIPPTSAEANPNENDLVIVVLSDGTKEYWKVDADGNYPATPDYTDEGIQLKPPRLVPGDGTIVDCENIVANNGSTETVLTIGLGVTYFFVGRDIESSANVTIVPPSGFTISGESDHVVFNNAHGQALFVLNGTDYVVTVPGNAASSGGGNTSTSTTPVFTGSFRATTPNNGTDNVLTYSGGNQNIKFGIVDTEDNGSSILDYDPATGLATVKQGLDGQYLITAGGRLTFDNIEYDDTDVMFYNTTFAIWIDAVPYNFPVAALPLGPSNAALGAQRVSPTEICRTSLQKRLTGGQVIRVTARPTTSPSSAADTVPTYPFTAGYFEITRISD